MKGKILFLFLLSSCTISAQLIITPGAQFSTVGNSQLTLQNINLVNNGSFIPGNSMISFTGNATSSISGSQPVQFFELEINKTNNSVILQHPIVVKERLLFTSGLLNLNGFDTDLGTTGHLDGEQENSRVVGPNGGEVVFNVNLNSPTGSNPANLGIFITTIENLGNVTIKRGHQAQAIDAGGGRSVHRYYDILPTNNSNLDATLRFRYIDGELNGLTESSLVFFKSDDGTTWTTLGSTSRDVVANFVQNNGISNFSRFTLFAISNPLPVDFTFFNSNCQGNKVELTWKTAQEENSSHFNIERSVDAENWALIGNLPAAGNSNTERSYFFSDNRPLEKGFYRIAEIDIDARKHYTGILLSSCSSSDDFRIWPNPVRDKLFINIVSTSQSAAMIKVFDNKGSLVKIQRTTILQGSNQLSIDMQSMAKGIYSVSVYWNNDQSKKTVQVLKQ